MTQSATAMPGVHSCPAEVGLVLLGHSTHCVYTPIGHTEPNMNLGYARTSTAEQHAGLDAQARDLLVAGVTKPWKEQVSSIAQREQLKSCLEYAREGDSLFVCKPDRLARSTA